MGLFSFIKEAGEKLFGGSAAQAAEPAQDLNAKAAKAIETYIGTQNLGVSDVKVQFDGSQGKVTVQGTAPTQAVKEKVTLCCGNVSSVQSVDNQMAVTSPVIFEANKPMLSHPDKIYPGQKLRIPAL
jgi:nucleoid-associated protein YgaU